MIPGEESRNCIDMGSHYVLQPAHHWWNVSGFLDRVKERGKPVESVFEYASHTNDWWVSPDELKALVDAVPAR
jgi:UDP-N-acetylglucosamine 4,6-dehydratase